MYFCLYGPFNCISFYTFSWQLYVFSLCSCGLSSALLVLSTIYLFRKVSCSPDIIPCGWLGSKHQLTNFFPRIVGIILFFQYIVVQVIGIVTITDATISMMFIKGYTVVFLHGFRYTVATVTSARSGNIRDLPWTARRPFPVYGSRWWIAARARRERTKPCQFRSRSKLALSPPRANSIFSLGINYVDNQPHPFVNTTTLSSVRAKRALHIQYII